MSRLASKIRTLIHHMQEKHPRSITRSCLCSLKSNEESLLSARVALTVMTAQNWEHGYGVLGLRACFRLLSFLVILATVISNADSISCLRPKLAVPKPVLPEALLLTKSCTLYHFGNVANAFLPLLTPAHKRLIPAFTVPSQYLYVRPPTN